MAEFINFQADVDKTDSETEDVNDDIDEVISSTDNSFEADNDPLLYYRLHNGSRDTERAIDDFLNQQNQSLSVTDEISSCFQESSSDDDTNKIDNFVYFKNNVETLKKNTFKSKRSYGTFTICYVLRYKKINK